MRLKSLRLAGFKSFANPTTFSFGKNITAIVGPNGCGKSNVIDAIRWVLGESSAKQLRGGAMSDVIFAGTQDKSAKSLASVELTFEHTQDEQTGIRHELNLYHELAVRRQVNREGKSDYFINGTRCRRRDVVDIFLGTGLGARSYAVIEQGMIGRIVDSNPTQLRDFIEEGAGVSRYQIRRLETQKKLNQATENLERLNDLKSELEKQQKALSKQAETAQRYKELSNQLNKLEQDIFIHQLYSAKYAEQKQQKQHGELSKKLSDEQLQLATQTALLDKLVSRITEQQWIKDDARDKHHNEQLSLQQAEHATGQLNNRIGQLIDKQNNFVEQAKDNKTELTELVEKQQKEQENLNKISPQLAGLQQRKTNIQERLAPLIRQSQEIYTKREELQNSQRQLEKEHALAEQAHLRVITEQQKWAKKQATWQQSQQVLMQVADIEMVATQLGDHKNTLASVLRQYEDISINLEEEQDIFTAIKIQVQHAQTELQTLEKQHASLNSEYNTLHALVYPPKSKTTQVSNKQKNNQSNINDTITLERAELESLNNLDKLSDKVELTSKGQAYADILDTWLAMWLDGLLINLDQQIINSKDGSTLLTYKKPHTDQTALLNIDDLNINNDKLGAIEGLLSLTDLIKTPKLTLTNSIYLLITATANINKTDNTKQDLEWYITKLPTGSFIITDTGWLAGQFGFIHLSKLSKDSGDSHFLRQRTQQRARLDELEEELNNIEDNIADKQRLLKKAQGNHDERQIVIEELSAQVSNLQNQSHKHRHSITELSATFDRQKADSQRLNNEKLHLEQEKAALETERKLINTKILSVNEQLPALNTELSAVENERNKIRFERTEADNQSRDIENTLQALQSQQQQLTFSLTHFAEQITRLNKQLNRFSEEENGLQQDIEKLTQDLPILEKNSKEQQSICHEGQVKLEEYQAKLTGLQAEHTDKRDSYNQEQISVAKQQQRLAEMTTQLAIAKERLNEACSRVDSLTDLSTTTQTVKSTENNSILITSTYVPARYLMMSQHYHHPYQHAMQALIATGQDKIRFATATELSELLNLLAKKANNTVTHSSTLHTQVKPTLFISSASLLTDFILHKSDTNFNEALENKKQQQRQQEYQSIQIQIGRIGAVNLVAVAELEQVNERLNPLSMQTKDILDSINKLTDAIRTIDNKTKELFLQTLELVNKDLLYLFNKVFGGGTASLTLIDDEKLDKKDKWRAGLELMAQPKGKKNARLAVLSGGEKTLTALSLIFAIFKQHPAPFCVLDEVDAPLDDANVARFTGLIEELASDLQFIFISHNKLSMQIADDLKGITMPNAGISTLVSVSLDEAERYVESSK